MTIRIASFNLQNDFTRPSAMMMDGAEGPRALGDHALASAIVARRVYSESGKQTLLDLDRQFPSSALDSPANAPVTLNKVRGDVFPRAHGRVSVTANGRSDWTGWFDLRPEDASRKAGLSLASARTSMTGTTARAWLKPQPADVQFRMSRAGKHRFL